MSERKINLEEILRANNVGGIETMQHTKYKDGNPKTHYDRIIDSMKEACRQTLELAAENAKVDYRLIMTGGSPESYAVVDKQSILDTINQVE